LKGLVRKLFFWKLKQRELRLGERTVLMGVLNVTPDSFSDGGKYSDPDRAFARAIELEEQGADVIDVGAESTRPGSQRVSEAEEIRRLIPVLKRLQGQLTVPISVDTYKAEVATRALDLGVEIINDPSGLTFEPQLARAVSNHDAGLILNHMRGRPETWTKLGPMPDPMGTIARELEATISRARMVGIDKTRIAIDPGLGFGKRREQNSLILGRLGQLAPLDFPIMVGPSRKSFLAHSDPADTKFANAAAVTAAILGGAHILRVHDVREMRAVADVADDILRAE
jgi:dihydropteroate synthase